VESNTNTPTFANVKVCSPVTDVAPPLVQETHEVNNVSHVGMSNASVEKSTESNALSETVEALVKLRISEIEKSVKHSIEIRTLACIQEKTKNQKQKLKND